MHDKKQQQQKFVCMYIKTIESYKFNLRDWYSIKQMKVLSFCYI